MLSDRVIFCDGEALILDKPAGLAVDPPKNGGLSLENYLASLTFGFERWPTAVHRLDRDTSGCLLLARNPKAHKRFAAAFEARQVVKGYVAVLEGIPAEISRLITERVSIPTIGIGAGPDCDGQILVSYDMLGLFDHAPSFVKQYARLGDEIVAATEAYIEEVQAGRYPAAPVKAVAGRTT